MRPLRLLAAATLTFVSTAARPASRHLAPTDPDVGTVTSVRVLPASGHADVVINVTGNVQVKDFTLSDPTRIVVDIEGATLGLPPGSAYDGVPRGAITNIRYAQFTHDTVRVVLTVVAPAPYRVARETDQIRIGVDGPAGQFAAWQVGGDAASSPPTAVVTPRDQLTPRPSIDAAPASASLTAPISAAQQQQQQQQQQRRITVDFPNVPVNQVLATFADYAGRTILPSKNVTGNITAKVTDQPWDVALQAILHSYGFDAIDDPRTGIITVETIADMAAARATQQSEAPLVTNTISLNFAKATSIAPMVQLRLSRDCAHAAGGGSSAQAPSAASASATQSTSGASPGVASLTCPIRGIVTADSVTNSLSITDIESSIPGLVTYARSLDRRPALVNIKAKIILVDRTALEGLGLRYDLGSQTQYFNDIVPRLDSSGAPQTGPGQVALGGNTIAAIANATQRIPNAALQLVYSTAMGAFDFTTFMEALQQTNLLDTQAEPSGTTLNNHTVNLTAGTKVPVRVIDAGSGANGSGSFPQATVSFQQTGVILIVTPQVTNNGYIQMVVHVENSDVTFSGTDATAFPMQSVDNVVLVPDGGTAVMGGLTLTTISVTKTGLPLLVDLPVIGKLFGVTQRQETKRDLLILITPHITDSGDSAGPGGG